MLTLELKDQHAPWNEGLWSLSVSADGSGAMERLSSNEGASADLACGISTWSALMMGYSSPMELHRFGRLAGSQEAARQLEAVIQPRQTYLMDFF